MSSRRIFGLFILLIVIVAALLVMWYIGSQKTVSDVMLFWYQ